MKGCPVKMKKWLAALLLMLTILCASTAALAADAMDITDQCAFKVSYAKYKYTQMTDKKFTTHFESNKTNNPWVQITAPAGIPIQGVYICFTEMPESWEIQVANEEGDWFTTIPGDTRFLHSWVQLPEPAAQVRLIVTQESKCVLSINELYVLSTGDIPSWVQRWEPTQEKADILFLATHPDDELIFFGGAIPTYAAEQGRKVVVAYFTRSNTTRQSELLNGLWTMGVRNDPLWGDFRDKYSKTSLANAYKDVGGKEKVLEWLTAIYRQYKPEVVVTQDVNGEYGHWQHRMIADAAQLCIETAAAEGEYLESFFEYGTWQVKKLYMHLWPENQIVFDWSVPLLSMGGQPSIDLAINAFDYHVTQHSSGYNVQATGAQYDNQVFGLAYTTVGEDVRKDDFLENIYDSVGSFEEVPATPAPTAAPTAVPAYVSVMPALNADGYLDEGEFIYSSEEEGLWVYVSQTAKVVIERKYDPTKPLTWFEAELWGDVEQGELLRTVWRDPEKKAAERGDAAETATMHQVVFAMNTDYFTYRSVSNGERRMGIVIRDGEIVYDNGFTDASQVSKYLFPNLDTLAFYPDGSLDVNHSYDMVAQDYIDAGAYAVYSFGPYLIKDGELSEKAYTSSDSNNPRCAIGMIEPGHYVAILCEGRLKRSGGVDIEYLAKMMRNKGCQVAFNLDGGQTAVMCFMGKQINLIGVYDGKTNARKTCDIMAFGTSEQVGVYEVK